MNVLLVGRTPAVIADVLEQVDAPATTFSTGNSLEDVVAVLERTQVDHVILGGGLDLDTRLQIVRSVFESSNLPTEQVSVDSIREIDTEYWFDGGAEVPTVRKVVEHARLGSEVDAAYPIILGQDGRVMDGMHRIVRALLDGRAEISAVRFPSPPEPDYRNCLPHELPY